MGRRTRRWLRAARYAWPIFLGPCRSNSCNEPCFFCADVLRDHLYTVKAPMAVRPPNVCRRVVHVVLGPVFSTVWYLVLQHLSWSYGNWHHLAVACTCTFVVMTERWF